MAAFRTVPDFAKVESYYKGKKIPEDEFFANTLIREFSIPRDRVKTFTRVFMDNLHYLKAFRVVDSKKGEDEGLPKEPYEAPIATLDTNEDKVRAFLDTCFVMMPFSDWNDRYYKEIFAPAIKDAGYEPVRADELFATGSVVEQIWEQIRKAKVLIAELTGKNPNVFYELGLAHAQRKPVVFTSGAIDDVPFDLRHLRMIIYDVREPEWSHKLRGSITSYLKSAKQDPSKCIPQPFRDMAESPQK
jgi:hypothetical protein